MEELSKLREKITDIDNKIARLFEERMELAKEVANYKKKNGLPILDAEREKEVIKNGERCIKSEEIKKLYTVLLKCIMSLSKKYQAEFIGDGVLNVCLGNNSYPIYIKSGILKEADRFFNLNRRVLIVTDDGVPYEYIRAIEDKCKYATVRVLPHGEESKLLKTIEKLCCVMLNEGFSRGDCVVAVGGGVVGDIAGFVASCFMRGVDFYNVPTTLLAQADASVGGKTAVNLDGVKNIVGSFYQPKAVLIDPLVLKTLSREQFASGIAEIIKMSMTFDKELFEFIESHDTQKNIEYIIYRALKIKISVVESDERESGLRRVLNFGHTLGHGIESITGLPHGHCVALGMVAMCSKEVRERLKAVLKKENLPTSVTADINKIITAVEHDKKANDNGIKIIQVEKIGEYIIKTVSKEDLKQAFKEVF